MSARKGGGLRRFRWLLVFLLLGAGAWWLLAPGLSTFDVADGSYLFLDVGGTYEEQPGDDLMAAISGERNQSMVDFLLLLRAATEDERVHGLVARVRTLDVGWAKAQELRSSLAAFRQSGKKLVAYIESEFGNGTLEYFVASAADEVFVAPAGSVVVGGLLAQYVFLGGVWENLDIDMQVVKIGEYKTAGDMYANREMAPPHREMAESLLDSLYGQFVSAVASARGMDEAQVRRFVDRGPMSVDALTDSGLVDGTRFLDEIERDLTGDVGFVDARDYEGAVPVSEVEPVGRVAVVFGAGTIVTGESAGGVVRDEMSMGSDTMREAFLEAAEDDDIDAIVFRVDSPGGSALASDLIWRATQRARERKPVVVSMSDVAGSGGYYVSAGATRILADPGTLTGSIGVVLAKPNLSGLLERFGVRTTSLRRGANAGIVSLVESFDEEELAQVRASMQDVYGLFVDRVASGRAMDAEAVDRVGRGRVWTGEQAKERGLVDELGGLLDAIDAAKVEIGADPGEKVEVVFYPRERGLLERISDAFSTRVAQPPWMRRLRGAIAAYDFPTGSILTLMPQQIEIR